MLCVQCDCVFKVTTLERGYSSLNEKKEMIKEYSLLLIVTGRGMWNCVEDQEFKYSCSYLVLAPTTVLVPSLRPQLHTTKTLLGLNDKMKCIVRQTKTKLEQCQLLLLPTKPPRGKRFATS